MTVRQCQLERSTTTGKVVQTTWLPSRYATRGAHLRLRDDGVWTDGWKVVVVGSESARAPNAHADARAHRRATGDALPRRSTG